MPRVEHEGRCPLCGGALARGAFACGYLPPPVRAPRHAPRRTVGPTPDTPGWARIVTLGWVAAIGLSVFAAFEVGEFILRYLQNPAYTGFPWTVAPVAWLVADVGSFIGWTTGLIGGIVLARGLARYGRPGTVGLLLGGLGAGVAFAARCLAAIVIASRYHEVLMADPASTGSWILALARDAALPAMLLMLCVVTTRLARRELRGPDPSPQTDILAAHRHSSRHREEVARSQRCGCFFCSETFSPSAIVEWIDPRAPMASRRCAPAVASTRSSATPQGFQSTPNSWAACARTGSPDSARWRTGPARRPAPRGRAAPRSPGATHDSRPRRDQSRPCARPRGRSAIVSCG
jgi:hypothetical protein